MQQVYECVRSRRTRKALHKCKSIYHLIDCYCWYANDDDDEQEQNDDGAGGDKNGCDDDTGGENGESGSYDDDRVLMGPWKKSL